MKRGSSTTSRQATLWEETVPEGFDLSQDVCENRSLSEPHSNAAHLQVLPHKTQQLNHVLRAIRALGKATSEDVEQMLSMSHQSASARFADAKRLKLIEKCGTRKTRSGCTAGLYRLIT